MKCCDQKVVDARDRKLPFLVKEYTKWSARLTVTVGEEKSKFLLLKRLGFTRAKLVFSEPILGPRRRLRVQLRYRAKPTSRCAGSSCPCNCHLWMEGHWLLRARASFGVGGKGQRDCLLHSFRVVWTWKRYETANSRNKPYRSAGPAAAARCHCILTDALTHWQPFRSSHCTEFRILPHHPNHSFACHLLRYLLNRQNGFQRIYNFSCCRRGISPSELRI